MAPLTFGFLMDPLEHVRVDHDSTFQMMLEAQKRGHTVRYFEQSWLRFSGTATEARMRTVTVRREAGRHFEVLDESVRSISSLDVLFMRKDPPVDAEFLHATQLVELCSGRPPVYINSPQGIRDANEKLYTLNFPELMPETCVSGEKSVLMDFIRRHPAGTILKPIDGFGGQGIVFCAQGDRNMRSMLEMLTNLGRQAIMAQAYVPQSRQGDKRIILVDGEPRGAVLRVPSDDDHRGNMAAGGKPVKTTLTEREKQICARLKPKLLERGLLVVGIDVLGDYLTEVNVTSPTGLAEINVLDQTCVETHVIQMAERLAAKR
ncbi:MAG: glutathione synthase [Hyalangium sp.]|uniref:glutathione synthase n=1 Tax=Hyalangium sp. TaxID=2028555 RepID=UPI00389A50F7